MQVEATISSDVTPKISPDFRDLLPQHTAEELEQLERNCLSDREHVMLPPVALWGNSGNTIIDGHHQYEIRKRLGLKIRFVSLDFKDLDEALQHAVNVQLGRRNLDASQRAIVFAKYPRLAHGGDRKSTDQGANLHLDLEALAKAAGVSKRTMKSATKVVDKGAPVIVDGVHAGDFAASDAAAVVELPEEQQNKIAAEAKSKRSTLRKAAQVVDNEHDKTTSPKPSSNGSRVVDGKATQHAQKVLSELRKALKKLGLFEKHERHLEKLLRDIKAVKGTGSAR